MEKKIILPIILIILGIMTAGCGQKLGADEDIDSNIIEFADDSGISKIQRIRSLGEVPEHNLKIFSVSYGEPQDCPSGCFYNQITGLRYRNKIGWLFPDSLNSPLSGIQLQLYDFDSNDDYLYTDDFFDKLKSDSNVYYQFLVSIVKDSDTSEETLLRISSELESRKQFFIVDALLQNTKVQQSESILKEIISQLTPHSSRTGYKESLSKAQDLLNNRQRN